MTLHGEVAATTRTDGVRFVFEVTNDGTAVEDITFRDAGKADFVVEPEQGDGAGRDGEDGNESSGGAEGENESGRTQQWRWSEGRMFAQVIETERLDPDESATYEGEWCAPDPGTYVVRATLRAHDHDADAECAFTVEE